MIVMYNNISYNCYIALKGPDYAHLLDSNGHIVASFEGVTNFDGFTLTGGDWSIPTPDNKCFLAVVRDDGTIGKGHHRCSDFDFKDTPALYVERPQERATGKVSVARVGNVCIATIDAHYYATEYVDRGSISFNFDSVVSHNNAFMIPTSAFLYNATTGARRRVNAVATPRTIGSNLICVDILDTETWIPAEDSSGKWRYDVSCSIVYPCV